MIWPVYWSITITEPAGALYATSVPTARLGSSGPFVPSGFSDLRVAGRELPALLELGLQQPLGVLLEVEVDRQLDVHAVHGRLVR